MIRHTFFLRYAGNKNDLLFSSLILSDTGRDGQDDMCKDVECHPGYDEEYCLCW